MTRLGRIDVYSTGVPVYPIESEAAATIKPESIGLYSVTDCYRNLGLLGLILYSKDGSFLEETVVGAFMLAHERSAQNTNSGLMIVGQVFPHDNKKTEHIRGLAVLSNGVSYNMAVAGSPFDK